MFKSQFAKQGYTVDFWRNYYIYTETILRCIKQLSRNLCRPITQVWFNFCILLIEFYQRAFRIPHTYMNMSMLSISRHKMGQIHIPFNNNGFTDSIKQAWFLFPRLRARNELYKRTKNGWLFSSCHKSVHVPNISNFREFWIIHQKFDQIFTTKNELRTPHKKGNLS